MTPQQATKLTRENRHKQDDDYIFNEILEKIYSNIQKAALKGENTLDDFMPYGTEMRFKHAIINKLKALGWEILEGSYDDEYGSYQKSQDTVIRWKL